MVYMYNSDMSVYRVHTKNIWASCTGGESRNDFDYFLAWKYYEYYSQYTGSVCIVLILLSCASIAAYPVEMGISVNRL